MEDIVFEVVSDTVFSSGHFVMVAANAATSFSDAQKQMAISLYKSQLQDYSDKIATVAVHPETGVVYIGTAYGLQSYRSTATAAESLPASNIYAFPNPVRPGYDGPIAVKGFTRDALVHVTDGRGHVVYATTAQGGQAIWNGRTSHGDRVASGTYYVFASDKAGKMRSVAKILIIR